MEFCVAPDLLVMLTVTVFNNYFCYHYRDGLLLVSNGAIRCNSIIVVKELP